MADVFNKPERNIFVESALGVLFLHDFGPVRFLLVSFVVAVRPQRVSDAWVGKQRVELYLRASYHPLQISLVCFDDTAFLIRCISGPFQVVFGDHVMYAALEQVKNPRVFIASM